MVQCCLLNYDTFFFFFAKALWKSVCYLTVANITRMTADKKSPNLPLKLKLLNRLILFWRVLLLICSCQSQIRC